MGVTGRGGRGWSLVIGLAVALIGGRVFGGAGGVGPWVTGAGLSVALAAAVAQALAALRAAPGHEARLETPFALAYLGCVLGSVALFAGSEMGIEVLGLDFDGARARARYRQAAMVFGAGLLVSGALPACVGHWAERGRSRRTPSAVDVQRVRHMTAGALSVALAGVSLMLIGYVASARNQTLDASYFKTSRPGDAVRTIVESLPEPLRVATFFPPANEVLEEVRTYLDALSSVGGITIEEYDRFADPVMAADFQVRTDGVVALRSGSGTERINLPTDLDDARGRLRIFDSAVQQALLKLSRSRRVAYFTTGHGELGESSIDPSTGTPAAGNAPADQISAFRQMLELLNYEVRDIGLSRGLGDQVPEDGAILVSLAPRTPFHASEMAAVAAFLDRGGSYLLALEPDSGFELDELGSRLGLRRGAITLDDERHLRETGGLADRRLIVTNRISSHPSVTTAGRQGPGAGLLLVGPVSLQAAPADGGPSPRMTIESLPSAFVDENGNYRFDQGAETKGEVGVVAAVEDSQTGMRALVFGDAEMFGDRVLGRLALNAAVAADGVRWLGREQELAGEVVSEEDVPMVHTRQEDVTWFYGIIFGAPAVVLLLGFGRLHRRRHGGVPGTAGRTGSVEG